MKRRGRPGWRYVTCMIYFSVNREHLRPAFAHTHMIHPHGQLAIGFVMGASCFVLSTWSRMPICVAFAPPAGTLPSDGTATPTIAARGDSTISSGAFYGGSLADSVQADAELRGSSGDVVVPLPNRDERKKYGTSMHHVALLRIVSVPQLFHRFAAACRGQAYLHGTAAQYTYWCEVWWLEVQPRSSLVLVLTPNPACSTRFHVLSSSSSFVSPSLPPPPPHVALSSQTHHRAQASTRWPSIRP